MGLFKIKIITAFTVALLLTACSSTDENEATRIADLPEIENKFNAKVLWHSSVDGVDDYYSRIKPYIAYNKIYTGSRDGEAVAFDIESGDEIWSVDLSDPENKRGFFEDKQKALLNGGPVAGGKQVFYGSENGKLFALDAETGALNWQINVKGEIIAAPALEGNTIVVNTSAGNLIAYDASTGEELWLVTQDVPPLSLRGTSAPVVSNGGVFIGKPDGLLSVFILANGQAGWSSEIGQATGSTELERVIDVDSSPVIFGDKIYTISYRGQLSVLELRNGAKVWQREYSSYGELAIEGNTIYLTDVKGHIYSIDRLNGTEKWSQAALHNRGVTGPVIVDNYLVVGDYEGYLYWLDIESGEFVSQYNIDGSGVYTEPTLYKGILYVQSRDGDLEAIKTP